MPKFSSKHDKRENTFRFESFHDGFTQEKTAAFLGISELSACKNLKYVTKKSFDNQTRVTLKKRQGTTQASNTALPGGADVLACTYYINQSKYILATAAKLYYLDISDDPVEIGDLDGIPTFTEFNSKLIIHDSGITKYWDGTTFDKINKRITDELLGTGDNIVTNYTGTLDHIPVEVSTISITFTDGTSKTISDNGSGALTGDVDGGGTNTINYTTGAYDFTCSGAPDDGTLIEIDYEQAEGAPKSKAGLVRKSSLYTWGDDDNPSRLTYSAPNDELATHSSSSGGYLDVDADDGDTLVGAIAYQTSMLLTKESSLHRIDDYPGDDSFKVEKLTDDLGSVAYRTFLFEGGVVSFISNEGWVAMHPSERYGDIQKGVSLSEPFRTNAAKYANSYSYSAYNQIDKQLWLSMASSGGTYLDYIFVANLATGGQLSLYAFSFGHSCFSYVNGEMLIGGVDGHLYKLDETSTVFEDNSVDYSDDCYFRTAFSDWGIPNNWKHNKKINVRMSGTAGVSANLKIYKNENYTSIYTISLSVDGVWGPIYDYSSLLIYDATMLIGRLNTNIESKKKFNYRSIMIGIENISGKFGVEIMGMDLKTGIMGDK